MMSFRRRTVQKPIRGTRTSPHTAQVITSSGNPSLDEILGGGLPIGSICLIEEDRFMTHAKVLAKYFLAEGVSSWQEIFLGSLDDLPAEMLRRLPKLLNDDELGAERLRDEPPKEQPAEKNGMRIAFRYNDLPLVNSEQTTTKIGHQFNLMEHMDSLMLLFTKTTTWDDTYNEKDLVIQNENMSKSPDQEQSAGGEDEVNQTPPPPPPATAAAAVEAEAEAEGATTANNNMNNNNSTMESSTANSLNSTTTTTGATSGTTATTSETAASPEPQLHEPDTHFFHNPRYGRLLNRLHQLLQSKKFLPGTNRKKNLLRICLTSLGSPLWYDDNFASDLLKFLTILRASVRICAAVCFITMPMHLIAKYDTSLVPKIRQLVDYSIELESFAGSERETHPAFKMYSGLLHLHKMSAVNTLAVHMPETRDLAFKLHRKKFVIEKMHLPPDLQETSDVSASAASADIMAKPTCGTGVSLNSNVSMDF